MERLSEDAVRALKIGNRLRIVWHNNRYLVPDINAKTHSVEVDDISDDDICCAVLDEDGEKTETYVSILIKNPYDHESPWPIDRCAGRGWFEFFAAETER